MARFYGVGGKVCSCLAFALLLCSIAMVPPGGLFADDGGVPAAPAQCPGIFKNGVYVGCESPGAFCTRFGQADTCKNSANNSNCTCGI